MIIIPGFNANSRAYTGTDIFTHLCGEFRAKPKYLEWLVLSWNWVKYEVVSIILSMFVAGTNNTSDKGYENISFDAMESWHMQSACMYDV